MLEINRAASIKSLPEVSLFPANCLFLNKPIQIKSSLSTHGFCMMCVASSVSLGRCLARL
jgi:hypothetical protein